MGKESARSSGDRFNPWVGTIPGGGNDNLLQYPWLGNPMDRGAWWATIRRITKRWTQVKQMSTHTHRRRNLGGRHENVYILEYHNLIILPCL